MYPLMQFSCVAGVVVSNSDLDIERGIVCYTLALLIFGSNVSHSQVPIQTLFDTAFDVWACSLIFMCFLPSSSQVHGPPPPLSQGQGPLPVVISHLPWWMSLMLYCLGGSLTLEGPMMFTCWICQEW